MTRPRPPPHTVSASSPNTPRIAMMAEVELTVDKLADGGCDIGVFVVLVGFVRQPGDQSLDVGHVCLAVEVVLAGVGGDGPGRGGEGRGGGGRGGMGMGVTGWAAARGR